MTIAHGEIDASDITAHLLFPTRDQGPFLPFERFGESVATSRKKGDLHAHVGQEVVAFVLEGYIDHDDEKGGHTPLGRGSLMVLTAHEEVRHALSMEKGRTARWLSMVVRLPWHTEPPATSLQVLTPEPSAVGSDGTARTALVGANGPALTSSGLELTDIAFAKAGNAFVRLGGERRGVAYVLGGSGSVEEQRIEPGQGALLENMSGVSMQGSAGYRVALASVPRPKE